MKAPERPKEETKPLLDRLRQCNASVSSSDHKKQIMDWVHADLRAQLPRELQALYDAHYKTSG